MARPQTLPCLVIAKGHPVPAWPRHKCCGRSSSHCNWRLAVSSLHSESHFHSCHSYFINKHFSFQRIVVGLIGNTEWINMVLAIQGAGSVEKGKAMRSAKKWPKLQGCQGTPVIFVCSASLSLFMQTLHQFSSEESTLSVDVEMPHHPHLHRPPSLPREGKTQTWPLGNFVENMLFFPIGIACCKDAVSLELPENTSWRQPNQEGSQGKGKQSWEEEFEKLDCDDTFGALGAPPDFKT